MFVTINILNDIIYRIFFTIKCNLFIINIIMEKITRSVSLCKLKKIYAYVHTNLHMYGHKYIPTYIQLYVYGSSAQFFKFTTDIISIIFYETKLSECLMSILCFLLHTPILW